MKKPGPLSVGDHVTLANNNYHFSPHGIVQRYVGYFIGPRASGRVYRVDWIRPYGAGGTHFESELTKIGNTIYRLKERPK